MEKERKLSVKTVGKLIVYTRASQLGGPFNNSLTQQKK